MKRSIYGIICFLLLLGIISTAKADGIVMLSQSFHLWGDYTEDWTYRDQAGNNIANSISGVYSVTSSGGVPISVDLKQGSPFAFDINTLETSFEKFDFDQSSHVRNAFPFSCSQGVCFDHLVLHTYAEGSSVFRPTNGFLEVNLATSLSYNYWNSEQGFAVKLTDLSNSNNLFSLSVPYSYYVNSYEYEFNVDPTHNYEFTISGWSNSFDGKYIDIDINTTIKSVPEPSTMLLLGLGLIGVAGIRRKYKG
jgi:hypothetical protein